MSSNDQDAFDTGAGIRAGSRYPWVNVAIVETTPMANKIRRTDSPEQTRIMSLVAAFEVACAIPKKIPTALKLPVPPNSIGGRETRRTPKMARGRALIVAFEMVSPIKGDSTAPRTGANAQNIAAFACSDDGFCCIMGC